MTKLYKLIAKFFTNPPLKNLTFNQAETMLLRLECKKVESEGSRVKFYHHKLSQILILHKPHPRKELKKYQILDIKNFITPILL